MSDALAPVSPNPYERIENGVDVEEEIPSMPPAQPKKAKDKETDKRASMAQTLSTADGLDYILMSTGLLGGIITGASIPVFNVLFGRVIDALNKNPDDFSAEVDQLCLSFLIVASANLLSGFLQVYCWSATGERQTQRFRELYVHALLSQEIGWFDSIGAGSLSTKVADVIGKIQDGTGRKIGDLIQYCTQVIAALAVAFYLCWQLTVVLLAAIPCIGLAGAYMISAVNAATHQSFAQYSKAGAVANETISSIRTIHAFNLQPVFLGKYRLYILEALRIGVRKGANVGLGNGLLFGVAFLTYALGFWYGGQLVARDLSRDCTHDCLTGGTILAVFFCTIMGSIALGQIAPPLTALVTAQSSIAVIFDLQARKPLIDGLADTGTKPRGLKGEITLEQVCFAYPSRPDVTVCQDLSLRIQHGETIALVGASGCGKSTIINLLLRFYDPSSGTVMVDEHDVRELNIKYLRSLIGYVGQEPILFAGSIGDNISYGLDPEERERMLMSSRRSGTEKAGHEVDKSELMERIIAAAVAANAHDFITAFPEGYDTDVGSNGAQLSGGQKQRIAIARALIKHPKILLLDEATSALDIHSEKIVQASIDALAASKAQTTVIIAHRLSTIVNADRICVISGGQIVESGRHSELITKAGPYADLVRMQMMSGEEDDEPVKETVSNEVVKRKRTISNAPEDQAAAAPVAVAAEEVPVSAAEKKTITRRIFRMVGQYPQLLACGLLGALFFGALFPCWGLMLAKTQASFFLDDAQEIRDRARLYAFFYILLAGVAFFGSVGMFYGIVGIGEHIAAEMRSVLFESYLHHPMAFFDKSDNTVGNLTTQLSEETRFVSKALGEGFARQLQAAVTLFVAIALGFSASWEIALIVLGTFPLNILASAVQMAAISGMQYDNEDDEKAQEQDKQKAAANKGKETAKELKAAKDKSNKSTTMSGSASTVLGTAFSNMRTVSAFSMQHKVQSHYATLTRDIAMRRTTRSATAGLGFGGSNTCLFLTYALLFWVGAKLIKSGQIDFEDLMTAILTLMLGAVGLGQALNDMGDQVKGIATARRIFAAIDSAKESSIDGLASDKGMVPMKSGPPPYGPQDLNTLPREDIAELTGAIELRDVHFRYPSRPDIEVAKGYNLTIAPGEVIAFVGPSGSGKSTIINLLLRFYDPSSGSILLDGMDITSLNLRYLRSQIGYVGQEPVLFSGSVLDNLSYGRMEINFTPLLPLNQALKLAQEVHNNEEQAQRARMWYAFRHFMDNDENKPAPVASHEQPAVRRDGQDVYDNCLTRLFRPRAPRAPAASTVACDGGDIEMGSPSSGTSSGIDADIISAAKFSHAHGFISRFSNGYHTVISTMGSGYMISGGQKQRLSVARAMMKAPKILLLDEATSALDAQSEHLIQQSIDALTSRGKFKGTSVPNSPAHPTQSPGKPSLHPSSSIGTVLTHARPTVIIVAHRLSTVVNADRIVVLDRGTLQEQGSHEQLMAKPDGLYRALFLKQSGGQGHAAKH